MLDEKELKALLENVNSEVAKTINEKIATIKDGQLTADTVKSMIAEASKEAEIVALKDSINTLANSIEALKEQGASKGIVNPVAKELKEKSKELKALVASGNYSTEIEVKTLVQRSAITNNQQAYDVPDIGSLANRKLVLYDLFPKVTLGSNNNGTVRYYDWDQATITRAAAAIAEGAAFPESVAKFAKYSTDLKKIGDTLPVTEEFFEDEEMFAAELGRFLSTNVDIEIDTELATGDGTSNKLTGIVSSATAYVPVSAGIQAPSIYDLVVKMSESITTLYGSKFMPNFALMNISDINKMKLTKDHNDNYVMPPFVSRDGSQINQIYVIECNAITANTMVIGDNRYATIYEKAGIVLSKGMVNTQFTEDELTLKARKRLLFLIRNCDAKGFAYCSDISTALTTLA